MKWIFMSLGGVGGLIVDIASPWSRFILDGADAMLASGGIANYLGLPIIVKGFALLIAFLLLAILGGIVGYCLGSTRH